jgi:hypothetical protein
MAPSTAGRRKDHTIRDVRLSIIEGHLPGDKGKRLRHYNDRPRSGFKLARSASDGLYCPSLALRAIGILSLTSTMRSALVGVGVVVVTLWGEPGTMAKSGSGTEWGLRFRDI